MARPADRKRKVVKTLAKGQITIPNEFREALGIGVETLLDVALVGDHLEITPLDRGRGELRRYTDDDIERFLEEDKLEPGVAERVRDMLKRGDL